MNLRRATFVAAALGLLAGLVGVVLWLLPPHGHCRSVLGAYVLGTAGKGARTDVHHCHAGRLSAFHAGFALGLIGVALLVIAGVVAVIDRRRWQEEATHGFWPDEGA